MANLLNFNETPNLLELVESYRSDPSASWELSESASCDEKTDAASMAGRTGGHLSICDDEVEPELSLGSHLSICDDEVEPGSTELSLGSHLSDDEVNGLHSRLIGLSLCADEGADDTVQLTELSLCADEVMRPL